MKLLGPFIVESEHRKPSEVVISQPHSANPVLDIHSH